MAVDLRLNGVPVSWDAEPWEVLLDCLQREGHYTTIRRCSTADCLTCTCSVDGTDVQSCQVFVEQIRGGAIVTRTGGSK